MDLLDSIMSKMAKPPSVNDKQKKMIKEQQKAFDEARNKEREQLSQFRREIERKIHTFMQDTAAEKMRLEPMEQVARSVVRDVADVAGLTTYTFGIEGEDRHVMVFKKDYPLDERELQAYRNGEEWNLAEAEKLSAQQAEDQRQDDFRAKLEEQQQRQQLQLQRRQQKQPGGGGTPVGGPKYLEKIDRLVGGRQTGKQAARSITVDNDRQFGFVRSELKKDKRTIEETLADIRAKKQQKLSHTPSPLDVTPTHTCADNTVNTLVGNPIPSDTLNRSNTTISTSTSSSNSNISRVSVRDVVSSNNATLDTTTTTTTTAEDGSCSNHGRRGDNSPPAV